MRIALDGFAGAIRALQARLLPNSIGVDSANQKPGRGDLRGWKLPNVVATIPSGRRTIYRMGRDTASDSTYWLSFPNVAHLVRGFIAADTSERTYYTDNVGVPKVTDNVIGLAAPPYPTVSRILGVPAPLTVPTLVQTTAGTGDDETRFYVRTFVTDKGEESAPSGPSAAIVCKPGAIITVNGLGDPPVGLYGITLQRIYRTQTGTSGATTFFFLREVAIGAASTTDDARALGEVLPSTTWLTPPADLTSLTGCWNGILAGITGRSVRYCEPFKPYAWPIAYETLIDNDTPVALATYQQTLVVLTTGRPRYIEGSEPTAMQERTVPIDQACISNTSVVSFGHGVVYASPDGLCYVGDARAPGVITSGLMRREDWQALTPDTIVGCSYEGLYFGFYDSGAGWKGFFLDPVNPQGIYFLDTGYAGAYSDPLTDAMYLISGTSVVKWDAGAGFMTARWRSKSLRMPQPINLGYAEVTADAYPVTFRLFADGALKFTKTVTGPDSFGMPSGYLALDYQVELEAPSGRAIQGVALAESVTELAAV
jgi:hypothetical protein